jgi:carboxymethylenebutenolidase
MTSVKIDAIDGSGRFDAYLAAPAGGGKVPAVIVIQEIRGVNANIRAICDDYASRGYLAAAPDMLWRIEPNLEFDPDTKEGWDTAMRLNAAFDENKGADDLVATLHWLRSHPRSNSKVGTVGYCLGGKLAYLVAVRSDIDVAVGYYGIGIDKCLNEATDATCPLMLHVAGEDRFVPPDVQQRIKQGLAPFDDMEVHIYPGADHAFARVDGIRYDDAAAQLANRRTAAFINGYLKGDAR